MTDNSPGYVYFVQRITGGAIKIGFSRDVSERVKQLQTAIEVPIKVLGTIQARPEMETALHEVFAAWRLAGEWFEPDITLVDFATGLSRCYISGGEYFGLKPAYRVGQEVCATEAMARMTLQAALVEKRKKADALNAEITKIEAAVKELSPIWDLHPGYTYGQAEAAFLSPQAAA